MKISKQARREAKELFRACMADGVLDQKMVRQAATRVIEARPRGYLAILTHFHRLVKLAIEERTAHIESAAPLAPDLQSTIQNRLTQAYGPGLDLRFAQNPALVGGLRIKVGSDVYDGSVQGRLAALLGSFSETAFS